MGPTSGAGHRVGSTVKEMNTLPEGVGDIDDMDDTEEKTPFDVKAEVSRK